MSVPNSLWSLFTAHGHPQRIEAGGLLWEPGEGRDDSAYLVLTGLVRLYHPSRKGNAVTLLVAGPGGLVGHHPELEHRPYSTGAEALCASSLLALPADLESSLDERVDLLLSDQPPEPTGQVGERVDEELETARLGERTPAKPRANRSFSYAVPFSFRAA